MTENYATPLDTVASIRQIGGKARSLARLLSAGFDVPAGFILTTAAYRRFIHANHIEQAVLDAAKPEIARGMLSFETSSARIQGYFASAEMPRDVLDSLREAHAEIASVAQPLAVRSSATAEDLPGLSFAGQHESYLNVDGTESIINAVQNCWVSLWSARALAYRHQMGIDQADVAMAVVVQRLVGADVSGVLFTANPATGARDEMVVNANYGLGEGVVGGNVAPDGFVLDRQTLTAKATQIGDKAQMVVCEDAGGTGSVAVDAADRTRASLSDDQLAALGQVAIEVERLFDGVPQDIEWLFADGKPWLLQSRPITHLPPRPLENVRWDPPEPGAYLQRSQWVEHVPEPVSTLFEDLHMKRSLQEAWGRNLSRRGNHDYDDTQPPACFHLTTSVNGYAYRQVGEPPRTGRPTPERPRRGRRRRLAVLLLTARMHLTFVPKWRHIALPRYLREIRTWGALDPAAATLEQLWSGIRALSKADARYWYNDGVWNAFALTRGTEYRLHNFLEQHAGGQFITGQFLSGLASPAFAAQNKLYAVARLIRENAGLLDAVIAASPQHLRDVLNVHPDGRPAWRALEEYFATYGHQVFTLDFLEPCEAEDPVNTLRSLHGLLVDADYDPEVSRRQLARQRRQAFKAASQYFGGGLKLRFWWRVWVARRTYPNRERSMFDLGRGWTVLRPLARELGRRLTAVGTLSAPDDIFFLTTWELGRAVRSVVALAKLPDTHRQAHYPDGPGLPEYARLAVERRQLRERRKRLKPPFLIPGPPPWSPLTAKRDEEPGDVMKGSAVSPGRVTAEACVVLSSADFAKMRPGTILVCPTTTPAWTQLFPQAKGLVTDIGGILAHGSIVAREYGIPAVLGLVDATQRIEDGQTITVDGDKGTVALLGGLNDAAQTPRSGTPDRAE